MIPATDFIGRTLDFESGNGWLDGVHPWDLPGIVGDPTRISEVVQNLVENAIKYMGDQAATRIAIGTRVRDGECVFFVHDNGKGSRFCFMVGAMA